MKRRASNLDMKVVVLGSANVGKTSIINRYCNGIFIDDTLNTIGAGFFTHTVNIDDYEVTLMLWDTAGEERFRSVAPSLLRGTNGLVLVFDLTSPESFSNIDIYMEMFLDTCEVDMAHELPILLLGNKMDLNSQNVSDDNIQNWLTSNKVTHYFEVSAKTGLNINEAFMEFLQAIVQPLELQTGPPIQIVYNNSEKQSCC